MSLSRLSMVPYFLCLVLVLGLILGLVPSPTNAAIETYGFANDDMAERFVALTEELRCPKCQNQSLADSDSIIATDLRRQVKIMIDRGQSDAEIRSFMVQRYGDFILYDPPFKVATLFLWLAPIILLLLGAIYLWRFQRRKPSIPETLSNTEYAQLQAILAVDKNPSSEAAGKDSVHE